VAFRLLIEANLPGSAEAYAKALANLSPTSINPAAGLQLRTLLKARADLSDIFKSVINRLEKTPTRVGQAIKPVKG